MSKVEDEEIAKRLDKMCPSAYTKILAIATYAGIAIKLALRVAEKNENVDLETAYKMSLCGEFLQCFFKNKSFEAPEMPMEDLRDEKDVKKKFKILMEHLIEVYEEIKNEKDG